MRLYPRKKSNGTVVWWASWTENKVTVRRSTRQPTRELAKLVTDRWARERADPEREKARQASFGNEAATFLESCRAAKLAAGTISMYDQKLANLCDIIGRETSMADVDAECVLAYFDQREQEGAALTTQYKEWIALAGVLKLARHKGKYPFEVARIKPPRLRVDYKPRTTWLTWEQADMLLAQIGTWTCMRQPSRKEVGPLVRRRTVAYVLATGCRRGEWMRAGLDPDKADIDWKRGVVRIHGTKTEGSNAEIPIPSPMRRWLAIAGSPPYPRWLSARRDLHRAGQLIEMRLRTEWKRTGRVGPEPSFPRVTWNDLRRTFVSLLLQAGVPPHVLKHLSRHKTTRMIDLVYGQQTTESVGVLVENALSTAREPSVNQPARTQTTRKTRGTSQ